MTVFEWWLGDDADEREEMCNEIQRRTGRRPHWMESTRGIGLRLAMLDGIELGQIDDKIYRRLGLQARYPATWWLRTWG